MTVDLGALRVKLEESTNTISREFSPDLGVSRSHTNGLKPDNLSRVNRAGLSVARIPDSTSQEQ